MRECTACNCPKCRRHGQLCESMRKAQNEATSLVVTEDGKYAVGLLFAATLNGGYGYIIPIEKILHELKMSLIGGHRV